MPVQLYIVRQKYGHMFGHIDAAVSSGYVTADSKLILLNTSETAGNWLYFCNERQLSRMCCGPSVPDAL